MQRHLTQIVFYLLLAGVSVLSGCGPTSEERRAAEEAERARKQSDYAKEEAKLRQQLESRHGKLRVLASAIRADAYTYELQQFAMRSRGINILFRGILDDVEKTDGGTIAEFSSVLGEELTVNPTVIIFRLKVKDEQLPGLLQGERPEPILQYLRLSTYTVVARIDSVSRIRRYEFKSKGAKEEAGAEVDVEVPQRFLAHGSLLEAIKPKMSDKERIRVR